MEKQTIDHDGYDVEINGKKRRLRLSTAAFRYAVAYHDSDIDLSTFETGFDPSRIVSLAWVALMHEDYDRTEMDIIKELMTASEDEIDTIFFVLGKALARIGGSVENFGKGVESIQGVSLNGKKTPKKKAASAS